MKIQIDELKKLIERKFIEKNIATDQIEKIVDYLLWAEMSGNNVQGVMKMFGTEPMQDIKPKYDMKIEKETPCSILLDAGANNSVYVTQLATEKLIEKVQKVGMGIAGIRNTFTSNGAQSYYIQQIAEAGYIGIICSRSPGAIAPYNSISPLFGTNPIGFGFPTLEDSFVFDMATSAITYYGLILAAHKGENIANNLAIDSNGEITVDPNEAMNGAILPFDRSYKGSSLALMVELLSGPLLNSQYCDYKTFEEEWGATIIAIDPDILTDTENFKGKASDMLKIIRASKTKNGEAVRLPGDVSKKQYKECLNSGYVEVEDMYLEKLGYKI